MIGCSCEVCTSTDVRDNRLRSSILVKSAETTITVDAGPDFRSQMLRASVMELDGIVFTHPHKDHVAGLDDVRAYNFFSGKPMNVYANEMTEEVLIREFPYAFSEKRYPGVPEIRLNTIDSNPFFVGDLEIIPIQVWHLRMPVLGFRFGNFTYITDANRIDEGEMDKIRGTEILVVNALRHQKHISHFNLEEAIALTESLGSPLTYFTHISHQLGKHADVEASLPDNVHLAYDGLSFSV
jgi:phosphoribosyl 1,2-cyclic phosphate phosphodiesterase